MEFLSKLIKPKTCKKGCFTVFVGPEKQRFVIKVKLVNHPLFMALLNDAAMEFGYQFRGPIELPCDVLLFSKVLAEIKCTYLAKKMNQMPGRGTNYLKGDGELSAEILI